MTTKNHNKERSVERQQVYIYRTFEITTPDNKSKRRTAVYPSTTKHCFESYGTSSSTIFGERSYFILQRIE
jgi:hypothetical protein